MKQKRVSDDEQFVRITTQYVAECELGRRPPISEYLLRYPQYAEALADFVAYYHTVEAPLVSALTNTAYGTINEEQSEQTALRKAYSRIYAHGQTRQAASITSLLITTENTVLTAGQLAVQLGVSQEIIQLLEQHAIDASSIPLHMSRQLALILQAPVSAIQQYFLIDKKYRSSSDGGKHMKVAEKNPGYPTVAKGNFLQAIEESATMTEEQKLFWREVVAQEQQKSDTDKSSF